MVARLLQQVRSSFKDPTAMSFPMSALIMKRTPLQIWRGSVIRLNHWPILTLPMLMNEDTTGPKMLGLWMHRSIMMNILINAIMIRHTTRARARTSTRQRPIGRLPQTNTLSKGNTRTKSKKIFITLRAIIPKSIIHKPRMDKFIPLV